MRRIGVKKVAARKMRREDEGKGDKKGEKDKCVIAWMGRQKG